MLPNLLQTRYGRLISNILGSGATRAINLVLAIATVPLTVGILSPDDYGVFSITLSLSVFATYADLGIGLAAVNIFAKKYKGDRNAQLNCRLIRQISAFLFAVAATGLLACLGISVIAGLYTTESTQRNILAVLLGVGFTFLGLPTGLCQRLLYASEQITIANAWTTGGRILSLIAIWIISTSNHRSVFSYVIAGSGVPTLINWLAWYTTLRHPAFNSLRPSIKFPNVARIKLLAGMGIPYVILQIVPYVDLSIDPILVGNIKGLSAVAQYDVTQKLFMYIPSIVGMAIFPLWPAISRAKAENDNIWIKAICRKSYVITMAFGTILSSILAWKSQYIINKWTNNSIQIPSGLPITLATCMVVASAGMVQSTILNALGHARKQANISLLIIPITIILKLIALYYFNVNALVIATAGCITVRILYLSRIR